MTLYADKNLLNIEIIELNKQLEKLERKND
jgi:hypothetical protein